MVHSVIIVVDTGGRAIFLSSLNVAGSRVAGNGRPLGRAGDL